MYMSERLNDIQVEAGSTVEKEIQLQEHEVQERTGELEIYTRLSALYTFQRNYTRSREVISLAIDMINSES